MRESRAFEEMLKVARGWLADRVPEDIAEKTGLQFDAKNSVFIGNSLGQKVVISYPDYVVTPDMDEWHQLVVLHYMKLADGSSLTGDRIKMRDLKDGMIRGGGFDHDCEKIICQYLGKCSPETLKEACLALGGKLEESNADLCVVFSFLPNYPVMLKMWFADDEFPASGGIMLDKAADNYLKVEDAVTVGSVLLNRLVQLCGMTIKLL